MSVLVIDASVAAKWFNEEEHAEAALKLLGGEYSLHAPDFFMLEMDSILCKWMRRDIINENDAELVRSVLRQVPVQKHPFEPLRDSAYTVATQTGRSVYDCLYVALAAILKGRMVTADRRLYDGLRNCPFKKHLIWIEDV